MAEHHREHRQRPTKRRAQMSCDRCKSRKTKCVNPVPGPCQFCASIGVPCHVDLSRRRQRPYYQVSEEEFRYMARALEHFMPDTPLNLTNLRDFVQRIGDGASVKEPARRDSVASRMTEGGGGGEGEGGMPMETTPESSAASSSSVVGGGGGMGSTMVSGGGLDDSLEDIDGVFSPAEWLVQDQLGIERFIAPRSSLAFQDIVTKHLQPNSSISRPPTTPLSSTPLTRRDSAQVPGTQIFLPRRHLLTQCLSRFFQDIHSVYWLFHPESITAIVNRLYAGESRAASPAIMCCLYCILALTGESEAKRCGAEVEAPEDPSARYLVLAKGMIAELYDRADIDTVRALCLLALLHHPSSPQQAYLYIGSAARIAYSLSLPIKKENASCPIMTRQLGLRLLCTLYLLDLDISLPNGYPPALSVHDAISRDLHLATEQLLCAGSFIPPGFQNTASKLSQITRQVLQRSCPSIGNPNARSSLAEVLECVSALHAWRDALPLPFRDPRTVLACHARSISILHLRYFSAMVLATRPFLLYVVDSGAAELSVTARRKTFQDLACLCIDAAERSLDILRNMQTRGLLSSLVALDAGIVVENVQIFLLVVVTNSHKSNGNEQTYSRKIRQCLEILQTMEATPSVEAACRTVCTQLRIRGIPEMEAPITVTTDILSGSLSDMASKTSPTNGVSEGIGSPFDEFFLNFELPMDLYTETTTSPATCAPALFESVQPKGQLKGLGFTGSLESGMSDLQRVIFQEM